MDIELQKNALPKLFHFAWVKAASQPHVKLYMTLCMRGGGRVKEDQGDVFSLDLYGARFEPQLFPDR